MLPWDQAEELFSADASSQAERFLALIADALLLTPSRLADETAGNERERIGTRRNETAVEPCFAWSEQGFESP